MIFQQGVGGGLDPLYPPLDPHLNNTQSSLFFLHGAITSHVFLSSVFFLFFFFCFFFLLGGGGGGVTIIESHKTV